MVSQNPHDLGCHLRVHSFIPPPLHTLITGNQIIGSMVIVARVPNIVVVGPISCYVTMVDHRVPIVFVTAAPIHIMRGPCTKQVPGEFCANTQ